MPSAWINQDPKQVKKHGADKASWYTFWIDPEGKQRSKSFGPGDTGRKKADEHRIKVQDQLERGTYHGDTRKKWADFRKEFEERICSGMGASTRRLTLEAMNDFERLAKPKKLVTLRTQTIDAFVAKRRQERGRREGDTISPATVNRQLRHLKAVLNVAHDWGYLPLVPKVRMLKEPGKLPRYVPPEHFAAIYKSCDAARWPDQQPYSPGDWWRALTVTAYMTGWRIGAMLALRREDVDLDAGTAISWHADNKGKRDAKVKLHAVVVEHLRRLAGFATFLFPWNHTERDIYIEFAKVQQAASIHLPCAKEHKHSDACHLYGFHDLRRAFATMNANRLSADALQHLMQHKSYTTTQRYINMAQQQDEAVAALHVPEVLRGMGG